MSGTHLEDLTRKLKPKTMSNLLLWFVIGFVVVFVIWAAFAELSRTVRAMGRVIPSSQLQLVSNLEGGVIEEILVRGGQFVRSGDPLIRLDPTLSSSELGSGEATLAALSAKIARLSAEVQGRSPVYPAAANPVVADQIRIEQALHASRMADISSAVAAGEARMAQAQRTVSEAQSAYEARATARDSRLAEVRIIRPLVEKGIEPRLSLVQAESQYEVAASEAEAALTAISRARSAVAEASSNLARVRQDWRAQAANELATAQAELSARRRAQPALANRVERTVLRAPLNGRINRVLVTTVGGTVRPGEPVVEIVPSDESLLIEARVTPQDIAFVRMDQEAKVAITAYDRAVFGALDGKVVNISPDAVTDPEGKETFYLVRVRTSANALKDQAGRPLKIGPGMIAEVDLLGDTRTVLQYILSPITKLSETAFRER